jgi:hypothetical protein
VVLTDPVGNLFCVMEERAAYVDAGPVAALPLDVADPYRDRDFWMWLTGWVPVEGCRLLGLRHLSHRGPLLELRPELAPKGRGKNRMHLDVRLESGDDADAVWPGRSKYAAGANSTSTGATCLGGTWGTSPVTSSVCCRPADPSILGTLSACDAGWLHY